MIWKVIGTICSLSFFVTGFSVLGDPDCVTAEIGGGRVIGVTCRPDTYGTWSGGAAGSIMLLIGTGVLVLVFWRELSNLVLSGRDISKQNFSNKSDIPMQYGKLNNSKNSSLSRSANSLNKPIAQEVSVKTCDKCNETVPMSKSWCGNCSGTSFTHRKISANTQEMGQSSEEAISDAFNGKKGNSQDLMTPEFKTCPMCAEEIKSAAKKCRYCQHMMED